VALTANAVSGAREMFLGEGFDEFISKPIELTSMTRLLRKMLKGESANE
jgi:CheY-like chemotaxis protein